MVFERFLLPYLPADRHAFRHRIVFLDQEAKASESWFSRTRMSESTMLRLSAVIIVLQTRSVSYKSD